MIIKLIKSVLDKIHSTNLPDIDDERFKTIYSYLFLFSGLGIIGLFLGFWLEINWILFVGLLATVIPQLLDMLLNYFTFLPQEEDYDEES